MCIDGINSGISHVVFVSSVTHVFIYIPVCICSVFMLLCNLKVLLNVSWLWEVSIPHLMIMRGKICSVCIQKPDNNRHYPPLTLPGDAAVSSEGLCESHPSRLLSRSCRKACATWRSCTSQTPLLAALWSTRLRPSVRPASPKPGYIHKSLSQFTTI